MIALAVALAVFRPVAVLFVVTLFTFVDAEEERPWTTTSACDRRCAGGGRR